MLEIISKGFPSEWLWQKYNNNFIQTITHAIGKKFNKQKNLFIDTTWFGPTFKTGAYEKALTYAGKIDNLFLYASVDPLYMSPPDYDQFIELMGKVNVFKIGNFDHSAYEFNFFAPVLAKEFLEYENEDLLLTKIKHKFINYNRKPRFHRVDLIKKILQHELDKFGLLTIGKPDPTYDLDPNNKLFLSLGEKAEDYVSAGHWHDLSQPDPTGIPHDVLSLHRLEYWQHHFLNVVGATMFYPTDDIFVSETQFKPILGLRPFVINGNTKTYQWLRDRGFKTFNHYFDFADLENTQSNRVHDEIIKVLHWVCKTDDDILLKMYNKMLPDLIHNQKHFYEYSKEQNNKVKTMFA